MSNADKRLEIESDLLATQLVEQIDVEHLTLDETHRLLQKLKVAIGKKYQWMVLLPFMEQHLLTGLCQIELAVHSLTMADYCRMQGL